MAVKIEITAGTKVPRKTPLLIERIVASLPQEHLRGLERLRVVESIEEPRVRANVRGDLPGLYHPRQGTQAAWLEVALNPLIHGSKPFFKRILPRLSFKSNVAAVIFSLVGQHYYLTLRHSVKKNQLDASVRAYVEKHLKAWGASEHSFRTKLFKPVQPALERWARSLQRRAVLEKKKASSRG